MISELYDKNTLILQCTKSINVSPMYSVYAIFYYIKTQYLLKKYFKKFIITETFGNKFFLGTERNFIQGRKTITKAKLIVEQTLHHKV